MKYCPYCGTSLPGSAISFCSECGRALPTGKPAPRQPSNRRRTAKSAARSAPKRRQSEKRLPAQRQTPAQPPKNAADEHYDGYYDDVLPVDAGQQSDQMDPELIKRIALLVSVAAGIIISAMVLMTLL